MIIHGSLDGSFDNGLDYPVSASFYTNSFLHKNGGLFDLTKLATRFDVDGGGHRDACGCRIKPLKTACQLRGELSNMTSSKTSGMAQDMECQDWR